MTEVVVDVFSIGIDHTYFDLDLEEATELLKELKDFVDSQSE